MSRGEKASARSGRQLLVNVREAAALLGVGRTTAYELIARGELEVVHIGRSTRVPVTSIEEYVERLVRRERAS